MQLGVSLTILLSTLLVTLTIVDDASASPYKRGPVPGSVTLPLKRIEGRTDVPPFVRLQQHINRSDRRHARMRKRETPTDDELRARLHKRMYIPATGPGSHSKRFNHPTINIAATSFDLASDSFAKGKNGNGNANANANSGATNTGPTATDIINAIIQNIAAGNDDNANGTNSNAAANTTDTANAAAASGTGISQADIDAANSGGLTDAETPSTADSLGLAIEANDVGYVADVQVGSANTTFKILMDSGSADFWIGSETCQVATQTNRRNLVPRAHKKGNGNAAANGNANGNAATNTCGNHTFLGTGTSSTLVDTGTQFQVTYGTGAVAGDIVTDDVTMAGLTLATHTFGVANAETTDFADDSVPFDGLMGLAQSTLSEQKTNTPVESLSQQGSIPATITSFKLGRLADGTNDGEVTFGSLDTSKFDQSTLTTFDNVNTDGFWEGAVDGASVDGQDLGFTGKTAILDTGTTLMVVPQADAETIHAAIPGSSSSQGSFTIPCTTTSSVAVTFGGTSFAINPSDLLFQAVDANDPTGDCVSGIQAGNIGGANEWLLGDTFLKNAYFSTNEDDNSISLATLV